MRLRDGFAVGVRQRDTVQTHLRTVSPRFFEIPKLDTFQDTFAGEFDDVVTSSEYPAADGTFEGGAIPKVHHQVVKENGLAADPQLNGAKRAIVTDDLDSAMISPALELCGA